MRSLRQRGEKRDLVPPAIDDLVNIAGARFVLAAVVYHRGSGEAGAERRGLLVALADECCIGHYVTLARRQLTGFRSSWYLINCLGDNPVRPLGDDTGRALAACSVLDAGTPCILAYARLGAEASVNVASQLVYESDVADASPVQSSEHDSDSHSVASDDANDDDASYDNESDSASDNTNDNASVQHVDVLQPFAVPAPPLPTLADGGVAQYAEHALLIAVSEVCAIS